MDRFGLVNFTLAGTTYPCIAGLSHKCLEACVFFFMKSLKRIEFRIQKPAILIKKKGTKKQLAIINCNTPILRNYWL